MNSEAAELRLAVANISREKTDVVHEALMMNADVRREKDATIAHVVKELHQFRFLTWPDL